MFNAPTSFSINTPKQIKSILEPISLCSTTLISVLKISDCKMKISIIELSRFKVPW